MQKPAGLSSGTTSCLQYFFVFVFGLVGCFGLFFLTGSDRRGISAVVLRIYFYAFLLP